MLQIFPFTSTEMLSLENKRDEKGVKLKLWWLLKHQTIADDFDSFVRHKDFQRLKH